jgi:hypothetical protein
MLIMLTFLVKNTVKKRTEALSEASREVGLNVDSQKLSIWMCLVTKMQENHNLLTDNK